jgi:hypothetical protein
VSRSALGFAGIHLLFAAAGMALLYALGFVSRLRHLLTALGPAYLAGLAGVMPVLILLMVLGVPIRAVEATVTATALTVALAATGFALSRRRPAPAPADDEPPADTAERWLARAGVAALGLYFAIGASAFAKLPAVGDDWAFWSYKGLVLYDYGGRLDQEVLTGAFPGPAHLDYPMLQPLFESILFRGMGGIHLQEWHIALWILFASFVWTVGFLFRSRGVGMPVLLGPLAALGLSPLAATWVAIGYGDVSVACFAAAGVLCVGLWLDGGQARYALLGGVLLAGAANTKNEGLTAAAAVLLAAAVVLFRTRRDGAGGHRWRAWAAAAGIAAAGALPWILWRSSHGLRNDDVPALGNSLDVDFLTGRLDRLSQAVGKLAAQLANQGAWIWIVPCFLVVAIVCLATGSARRQAAFYLGTAVLMMLSLYWVYWTGRLEARYWLEFSGDRVVTGVVFVSAVGLIHLLALVLSRRPPDGGRVRA